MMGIKEKEAPQFDETEKSESSAQPKTKTDKLLDHILFPFDVKIILENMFFHHHDWVTALHKTNEEIRLDSLNRQ